MNDGQSTAMLNLSELTGDATEVAFIVTMPGAGEKRYPMRAVSMLLGRTDAADICVKEPSISSRHCEFRKENGRIFFKDVGSANGSFLNGQKIMETELFDGTTVKLGNVVTVRLEGGPQANQRAPQNNNHNQHAAPEGGTLMLDAGQLASAREQVQAARQQAQNTINSGGNNRRPAPAPMNLPPPSYEQPQAPNNKKMLIIGGAIGGFVLIAAIVGFILYSAAQKKDADRSVIHDVARDVVALTTATPCAVVQESVNSVIKLDRDASLAPPVPPAKSKEKPAYEKYIALQRQKASEYKKIASAVESTKPTVDAAIDRIKSDIGKIQEEQWKKLSGLMIESVDERAALATQFTDGWKKIASETDNYANLIEAIFMKGNGDPTLYSNFKFTKQPSQLLKSCKDSHESNKADLQEKIEAVKKTAEMK